MRRVLSAAVLGTALAACSVEAPPPGTLVSGRQAQAALEVARDAWQSQPDDYVLLQSQPCLCPSDVSGPFVVTVTDGQVSEVVHKDGVTVPAESAGRTVEELHQLVATALANGELQDAEFSAEGIPTRLVVDPDPDLTDDELFVTTELVSTEPPSH